MKRRFKINIDKNTEFDLDLAPLLAVMVKLVPVLLISSAFVQMMIIETNLPQVVQEAIKKQDNDPNAAQIAVEVNKKEGIKIVINQNGKQSVEVIGFDKDQNIDYSSLQAKFVEVKQAHPEIFKIDLTPDADIAYKDLVKIMDEARRVRSANIRFPVKDAQNGKDTTTDYMFPEIVFSNMLDG
jgi:biopolymer transport protein ExbD